MQFNVEVVRRITSALDQAGISYMISGSFASSFHGAIRSTADLDVVIQPTADQLSKLVAILEANDYYAVLESALQALSSASMFNVIDRVTGWKIDLIFLKPRSFSTEEFSRRQRVAMDGLSVYMISPEDIILIKLEWAKAGQSHRQLEDVTAILKLRWDDLDHAYLAKWKRDLGVDEQWASACVLAGHPLPPPV